MVQRRAINDQKQDFMQYKKGIFGPFLSRFIKCASFAYFAVSVLFFSVSASANELSKCEETDTDLFFSLINATVDPYLPTRDRNGNTLLSADDVFIQKSQHYFLVYKDFEPVSISMDRFAAMTELNTKALENFESKITVLGPGCQQINLYRNRLVGSYKATFDEIIDIVSLGHRSGNNAIIQFASRQLKPVQMKFDKMIEILGNDLALDENVVNKMLSNDLRRQFAPGNNIPLVSLSEMVLLAFSSMGGKVESKVEKAFIFVPQSFRGIEPEPETIMLTSDGEIHGLSGFDYNLAAKVLNRLGVRTYVVTLSEVYTKSSGSCNIDMARTWMQIVEGQKVRNCPFPELVRKMLSEQSFSEISDFKNKSIVFEGVIKALNR
ncbi:hypothetical protein OAV67_03760 [Alphaproteobacteria bacterium]|nr:hypothetical protein [Alphaproteobacteria bacterium]